MRYFSIEPFLGGALLLGLLCWTPEVEIVRLGVPSIYEHIAAYALFTATLIAANGLRSPSLFEIGLIILLASVSEALKYHVPFRHPKTSDFYADLVGCFVILIGFTILTTVARGLWRVTQIVRDRRYSLA